MCSSSSDRSSSVWSRLVERHLLQAGRPGGLLQGEEPGDDQADEDGGDQVEQRPSRPR